MTAPTRPVLRCAHCGRPVEGFDGEATAFRARLSHTQLLIFRAMMTGGGQYVRWQDIAQAVYGDDPHGGPEDAASVITAMVHRMRKKLAPLGVVIEGHPGGSGGYRLAASEPADA